MKKLAVFALVLALSSLAGAALVTTVDIPALWQPGDTIIVKVGNNTPSAGGTTALQMMVPLGENGTIGLLGSWMLPGTGSSVIDNGDGSLTFDWADGTIGLNVTGDWVIATFDIPANAVASEEWTYVTFSGTMFGQTPASFSLPFSIVPEPATIVLLGIGGLFLRR